MLIQSMIDHPEHRLRWS